MSERPCIPMPRIPGTKKLLPREPENTEHMRAHLGFEVGNAGGLLTPVKNWLALEHLAGQHIAHLCDALGRNKGDIGQSLS